MRRFCIAPAGLTVTALARALPWCWAEQERQAGIQSCCGTGQNRNQDQR